MSQLHRHALKCIKMQASAPKWNQMHSDAFKCIQMHSSAYKCTEMHANAFKCIRMHPIKCIQSNAIKCIQVHSNEVKCIQMNAWMRLTSRAPERNHETTQHPETELRRLGSRARVRLDSNAPKCIQMHTKAYKYIRMRPKSAF